MVHVGLVTKCFILNENDQILTLLRTTSASIRPGKWDLAGGMIELNENPNTSISREISEETGITTSTPEIMYVATESSPNYILTFFYKSKHQSGAVVLSDEHEQYKWISIQKFTHLELPNKFHVAAKYLN